MQMDRTASSLKKKANNRLVLVGYRTSRSKAECSERSVIRMSDSGLKWVRLAPNVTDPGIFFRSDSVHFGSMSQNVLNLIWKKIPEFVPFQANLTHFVPKSDIHELHWDSFPS